MILYRLFFAKVSRAVNSFLVYRIALKCMFVVDVELPQLSALNFS